MSDDSDIQIVADRADDILALVVQKFPKVKFSYIRRAIEPPKEGEQSSFYIHLTDSSSEAHRLGRRTEYDICTQFNLTTTLSEISRWTFDDLPVLARISRLSSMLLYLPTLIDEDRAQHMRMVGTIMGLLLRANSKLRVFCIDLEIDPEDWVECRDHLMLSELHPLGTTGDSFTSLQ